MVLHADDFGMNTAVNDGIITGFSQGLLTSTSLLSNGPAAAEALRAWRALDEERARGTLASAGARARLGDRLAPFDLGVHLNLTQGRPLTGDAFPHRLLDRDGRFPGIGLLLLRLTGQGRRYRAALRDELEAQIEFVLDHSIRPTHLNGHQYVELLPEVSRQIPRLLERYRIGAVRVAWETGLTRSTLGSAFRPAAWGMAQIKRLFAIGHRLRMRRCGASASTAFFGTAHAGCIDLETIAVFLRAGAERLIEIGIHPGRPAAPGDLSGRRDGWDDPLAALRPAELSLLTGQPLADLLQARGLMLGRLATPGHAPATRRAA